MNALYLFFLPDSEYWELPVFCWVGSLVPDLRGKTFSLSPLGWCWLRVYHVWPSCVAVCPFYTQFVKWFIMKGCCVLSNVFPLSVEMIMTEISSLWVLIDNQIISSILSLYTVSFMSLFLLAISTHNTRVISAKAMLWKTKYCCPRTQIFNVLFTIIIVIIIYYKKVINFQVFRK